MILAIVVVFLLGYLFITLENNLKVNKTAIALLLSVVLWTMYVCGITGEVPKSFVEHVGDTCEIIFFLLGAMTIVEVVDANGGFNFVRQKLATRS